MFLETGATVIGSSVTVMDQRRCVRFAFVFVLFTNTTCVRMKSSQKPSLSLVSLPPLGPSNHRNENRIFFNDADSSSYHHPPTHIVSLVFTALLRDRVGT